MLSDFRFSRGSVLGRILTLLMLAAPVFISGCAGSGNSVTIGPPAKLAFAAQPAGVSAGSSITVTVNIEDASGHVVTTATNQVTIAIGANPSSGTLSGTATATAVAGVATFPNLSINNAGTGYTLAASASGLSGATTTPFNVVGPPAKLAFSVQPVNVAAGSAIAPAVTVSIEDANNNVVASATNQITIAIGTNPSSGVLGGTAQANAVAGVATFSNLSLDKVGTGYTLAASGAGFNVTSNPFNVAAGAAAKLVITTQPVNTTAGVAIGPVLVKIEDSQSNVVTTATNQITIAVGTNPSSGTLSGTAQVSAVAGVATFSTLNINKAGTGYTLAASAAGLTGATSSAFNILVGAAAKLAFTVPPVNVAAGSSIAPAVVVSVEDAAGNVVPTAANQITIAIGTNPSSGTLSGTAQVNAVAGVASFSTLSINKVGNGYTLAASAGGLTGATSSPFNVTAGVATKLVFSVQPANATAGAAISPAIQVTVEDSQNNVVTTAVNQITIAIATNPSSGTLSGTAQANAVAGVATFSTLSINSAGIGYSLGASASGLTGATSTTFNIAAGTAAKLVFVGQPTAVVAGNSIAPAVQVNIQDALGNLVITATNQITVTIGTNPSSGTLSGTAQLNAVAGIASFSTLSINKSGTGYTLGAAAAGLTSATSSAFNVTPAAASKLVFTAEPVNTVSATSIAPSVTVSVEDQFSNVVPSATNLITVAIGTNPSAGTLSGTVSVSAVNGVATFSTLNINNTGNGYTLTASASGLTSANSTAFNILVFIGPPAKLAFTVQPGNVVAGSAIAPAIQVTVEDSNGNQVASANNQITIAIGTNPSSGSLSGTAVVNAVSGVATFSTLNINNAGTGYTLGASASGLTGATSSTFNVTAGAAAKLAFSVQPTAVAAGSSITPAVQVSIQDSLGNLVTSATNQITIAIGTNPSSGTLSGTAQLNAVAGVASFSTLSINKTGAGYTLGASATSLTSATSNAFNVTAGVATKLAFTVQPSNVPSATAITPSVTVSVEDAQSNVVTSAVNQITIAIGTNPASGTLSGTAVVNAVAGVATFSTLNINNIGTGYTLSAGASGLTSAISSAFNVTAGCSTNCTISGTVSGPTISGVAVALSGGPTSKPNTATDGSGNYSFTGLAGGTYTVTPSLAGYTFSPVAPAVVTATSTTTQNFTETSTVSSFDITGTLTYAGSKTGRTYIRVFQTTNCGGGCEVAGTSLASAPSSGGTPYTVRGLQPGSYFVVAEVDTLNTGIPNASNPFGSSSTVTITSSNGLGNVTLTDPSTPVPVAPCGVTVAPGNTFALLMYNQSNGSGCNGSSALQDNNGREIATSYEIYYDTNSSFTNNTFVTFAAHGTSDRNYIFHSLAPGTYFFKMYSLVGATKSAASPTVSAVISAVGVGANTVSGTVTFPGTATGPLYVGVFNGSTIYGQVINTPYTSPVSYSYSGVPAGNYQAFAIIDQNNNGLIEASDIANANGNGGPPPLTVGSGTTTNNVTLTSAVSTLSVGTSHSQFNGSNDSYSLNFGIAWGSKRPVAITLVSGPNVIVPWDIPTDSNNGEFVNLNSVAPSVGDTYQFQVTFSDATTQILPATVSAVLNSFVTSMTAQTTTPGSVTAPLFTWVTPASTPSPYTYSVGLFSVSGGSNVNWNDNGGNNSNGIPSGTTSVLFNADGSAQSNGSSISNLPTATNYQWFVIVQDSQGNSSQEATSYNIP